ncbi:MAG: ABC transporter ATP-binding protein [Chloroflexi bacterium]|nr:ABC transporter ATP-binding protein [Chloroflexota bacterium]MCI0579218.1 ABC transporter ATP-binding protein [Chloroflexota bacterium]MCI0644013.1 ABC transporter ATP-binding protein [Chloroflexota bacterium]MCI0728821.1 ABC transporter ATP-binding protein [Chloroflexota bacterium]
MSEQPVIRFENVSKRFVFSASQPQTVLETVIAAFSRRGRQQEQALWAVKDVTFDVMAGNSLGIIGRNGSGKSTLLKLAAGILRPTTGRIVVRGRLSALLELGAGFHPDLTGRENIFLNAAILGLTREDVLQCYDSIVAFSELDEFINVPVKHYSSGMYMRLGFSVAVHVSPDILIVDEILAVGDQAFQEKCMERIHQMKRQGTTIILVSHTLDTMRSLCSHLVWLEHGAVQAAGPADEVIARYLQFSHQKAHGQSGGQGGYGVNGAGAFRRWGTGEIEITGVRFLNGAGEEQRLFQTGEAMTVEIAYTVHRPVAEPEFGLAIFRHDGVHLNGPNHRLAQVPVRTDRPGRGVIRYRIHSLPLLPALYRLTAAVHDGLRPHAYDFHEQAYTFRVVAGGNVETEGVVEMPATWEWELEPAERLA